MATKEDTCGFWAIPHVTYAEQSHNFLTIHHF